MSTSPFTESSLPASAPELRYYYRDETEAVVGPVPWSMLERMKATGLVDDQTEVCREGAELWLALGQLAPRPLMADETAEEQPGNNAFPRLSYLGANAWLGLSLCLFYVPIWVFDVLAETAWPRLAVLLVVCAMLIGCSILGWKAVFHAYNLQLRHPLAAGTATAYSVFILMVSLCASVLLLAGAVGLGWTFYSFTMDAHKREILLAPSNAPVMAEPLPSPYIRHD